MSVELPLWHWKFSGLPDAFFNYAENFETDPTYKATTLPRLGLKKNFNQSIDVYATLSKPWESFTAWVENLNEQSPDSIEYKVLYITRHGLGYHNAFEAQVGREAWNVSLLPTS